MLGDDEHIEYWRGMRVAHEGGTLNAAASDEWKAGFAHGKGDLQQIACCPAPVRDVPREAGR